MKVKSLEKRRRETWKRDLRMLFPRFQKPCTTALSTRAGNACTRPHPRGQWADVVGCSNWSVC